MMIHVSKESPIGAAVVWSCGVCILCTKLAWTYEI